MLMLIRSEATSTVAHKHGGTGTPTIISCVMIMIPLSCQKVVQLKPDRLLCLCIILVEVSRALTHCRCNQVHNKYVMCITNTFDYGRLPEEVKGCVVDPLSQQCSFQSTRDEIPLQELHTQCQQPAGKEGRKGGRVERK